MGSDLTMKIWVGWRPWNLPTLKSFVEVSRHMGVINPSGVFLDCKIRDADFCSTQYEDLLKTPYQNGQRFVRMHVVNKA